jgi:hypothetical protein
LGTTFAAVAAGDQTDFLSLAYQLMERLAALTHAQHSLPDRSTGHSILKINITFIEGLEGILAEAHTLFL